MLSVRSASSEAKSSASATLGWLRETRISGHVVSIPIGSKPAEFVSACIVRCVT